MNRPAKIQISYRLLSAVFLLLISLSLMTGCSPFTGGKCKVTFRVLTDRIPDSEKVYITGNDISLGLWNTDKTPLKKMPDGSWQKALSFSKGTQLEYKFTRGTWFSEGVDEKGMLFKNFVLEVVRDTTVTIKISSWLDARQNEVVLAPDKDKQVPGINLSVWKYQPGDNLKWADPLLDDSSWEKADPNLLPLRFPAKGFNGTGWFRVHIVIDSSLWGRPFALNMWQAGASEIYVDGELTYKFGEIGTSERNQFAYEDRNPHVLSFQSGRNHVIAVRYSNYSYPYFKRLGVESGFGMTIGGLQESIAQRVIKIRNITGKQTMFTIIPFAFAIFHFLLFIFYPRYRENLYYAFCMLCFAGIIFSSYQISQVTSVKELINFWLVQYPLRFLTVMFGFLTYRALVKVRMTKFTVVYILAGTVFIFHGILWHNSLNETLFFAYFITATLVIVSGFFSPKIRGGKDSYILGAGFLILAVLIINDMLSYYGYSFFGRIENPALYGMVGLSGSMLIYLSRKFASTTKDLELQLIQVKELSEKTIAQERIAKKEEIKRKVLEADNLRKTKELEEARQLQLSMLPKAVPSQADFEIAVSMTTAVEVGGDYYDFRVDDDGSLLIAIGDATGHGLKAGIMVAAMKSIFSSARISSNLPEVLNRWTDIFRQMHFEKMYMALTLVKVKGRKIIISAAGMPPVLLYRAETRKVETITIKGMPLGAVASFPYCMEETEIKPGDTLLLMSDGFIELFNEKLEMLDLSCATDIFGRCAEKSCSEIVDTLQKGAEDFRGMYPQTDDMTFVVLKVRSRREGRNQQEPAVRGVI